MIGPILAWFFRNTPYFEGRENPYPLLRQRMWDYLDFQRTNVIPGLFDPRFGWEDYAVDVLSTPMMFADLTHTPEALAVSEPICTIRRSTRTRTTCTRTASSTRTRSTM